MIGGEDDEDVTIYPLLGYGTGVVEGAVAISLEMALDEEQYESREGSWISTAMTADQAIEFGKELILLGERARTGGVVN